MAEARQRVSWGQLSALMALLANCHRDPKKRSRPFEVEDFDPTQRRAERAPSVEAPITVLQVFCRR